MVNLPLEVQTILFEVTPLLAPFSALVKEPCLSFEGYGVGCIGFSAPVCPVSRLRPDASLYGFPPPESTIH